MILLQIVIYRQEEMYQNVIHHHEDKQRELMLENTDLRDCLVQMQKELVTVINGEDIANCSISPNDVSYLIFIFWFIR